MPSIEQALEVELKRLVEKYGFGRELNIAWMPAADGVVQMFGSATELRGEVINLTLVIYEHKLEEALVTLTHEYFEYIFNERLIRPYTNIIEGLELAIQKTTYQTKETLIEVLVDLERKERKKNGSSG